MPFAKLTRSIDIRTLILISAGFLLATPADAAPRKPTDDAEVIERLPVRANDATTRELAELRRAQSAAGQNPQLAAQLAERYFDLAMARGDPRYVGYAETITPPNPTTAICRYFAR